MISREFDPGRDGEDCHRIWREVGWIEKGQEKIMDTFIEGCRVLVADISGRAETMVASSPGSIMHGNRELSLCAVTAVTTGYAGRRQGLAGGLTARLVALGAMEGAEMAGLGMFDQGYYDKLGFGSGPYECWLGFDPATLRIDIKPPPPMRLGPEDHELVHRSRLSRKRFHGSTTLFRGELTRADMEWSKKGFGLGYMDSGGERLSHHFWCGHAEGEHGPYTISWMCFSNYFELIELLALIRNLGDQVSLVRLSEPTAVQLQDLIRTPFRQMRRTRSSKFETTHKAYAYWQIRICDMEACMAKTHWSSPLLSFNLRLTDPIEGYLDPDMSWRGVAGNYTITLGPEPGASPGCTSGLPTMEASVGAFTRMWFGVRPATGLAVTDDLAGPSGLLEDLDEVIRLPVPSNDWEY